MGGFRKKGTRNWKKCTFYLAWQNWAGEIVQEEMQQNGMKKQLTFSAVLIAARQVVYRSAFTLAFLANTLSFSSPSRYVSEKSEGTKKARRRKEAKGNISQTKS